MGPNIDSYRALFLVVSCSFAPSTCFAENWITAPQVCVGRPHSMEARAADWQFESDQRVLIATEDSRTMHTSVFPGERANFVVHVTVRLDKDAECRLILDELTFDLTNSGATTQLVANESTRTFENLDDDSRIWTRLAVRRRDGKMAAHINGRHAIDLNGDPRAFEQIGLRSTRGAIAVRIFSLTGNLERRAANAATETPPTESAENPAGLDEDTIDVQIAKPAKELAVEKKTLPTLRVRVLDEIGEPITRASVLLYDRNHYMAAMPVDFEQVFRKTDEDGWADLGMLPQEFVCVQVNGRTHSLSNRQARVLGTAYVVIGGNREGGFQQANPEKPMANIELDDAANTLVITFTMRQGVDLQFEALDTESGAEVFYTGIFYRDEQQNRWWHPVLLDGSGGQHDFWPMAEDVSGRLFRVASPGYYPVDFQWEEKLELGKQYRREIQLTPAPDIRFTVLTPEGETAEGANFKWIHPKGLDNITIGKRTSDGNGVLVTRYPAQGEVTSFEITHKSGRAAVAVKDLPKPITATENGENKDVILCEVHLSKLSQARE